MKRSSIVMAVLLFIGLCSTARAQWVQTNGPYGGYVRSFAVSGTKLFAVLDSSSLIVMRAQHGGSAVFLSTDNGMNWRAVDLGLPAGNAVGALAVSGTDLFAGTNGGGGGADIFLSTNNGTSWTAVNTGLPIIDVMGDYPDVRCFAVSPNGAGGTNLFAGTWGSGFFLSTNNGTNWTAINNALPPNTLATSLAVSGSNLFAGTFQGGVFLSTNSGSSWTSVSAGLSSLSIRSLAVSPFPNAKGGPNLFALSGSGPGGDLYLSTDNGTIWNEVSLGLPKYSITTLAVGPQSLGIMAGTASGNVFRSTDNGTSWAKFNIGLTQVPVFAVAEIPNGAAGISLFAGTFGCGIFRSTNDGARWTPVNDGLMNLPVSVLLANGTELFAGTYAAVPFWLDGALDHNPGLGIYRSSDKGVHWVQAGLMNTNISSLAISPNGVDGTNLFAGAYQGGIFRSTSNGTSWTAVNSSLTDTNVICLAVNGTNLFAGTCKVGVFLSSDNGTSWKAVNTGWPHNPNDPAAYSPVSAFAVSGTNLFAGNPGGVFLSTNNGASWTSVNNGLANRDVRALAISDTNLFAGLITATSIFPTTTAQVGVRSIQV